jgi:hypothetical protein
MAKNSKVSLKAAVSLIDTLVLGLPSGMFLTPSASEETGVTDLSDLKEEALMSDISCRSLLKHIAVSS